MPVEVNRALCEILFISFFSSVALVLAGYGLWTYIMSRWEGRPWLTRDDVNEFLHDLRSLLW